MDWQPFLEFLAFAGIGLLAFLLWWAVYDHVLTRGLSVPEAIFGRTQNLAVALDVAGGLLAMGVLAYSVIAGPALASFARDVEAVALDLLGMVALLGLLRLAIAAGLRLWFGNRRDQQGDVISLNNELFRQRNVATGLFSTGLYLILAAGLVEQDLLGLSGFRMAATWNMLGTWLVGALTVLLHSWLYLGLGGRQNILTESFHRNNPAAPTSLLGLLAGTLLLNHALLGTLEPGQHLFAVPEHWIYLGLGLASVFALRAVLHGVLRVLLGVSASRELLERHNAAWGVLDGALIFAFYLSLIALIA
jgi:hypothetical protein